MIPDWPSQQIILANAHGLHARPATQLVNLTKQFSGDIQVAVDNGAYVSAKSLTKLLALGCRRGQRLTFIAQPETDAVDALVQIIDAVRQGLGEEVEHFDEQSQSIAQTTDTTPLISFESDAQLQNSGIAASTGLAFSFMRMW